MKTDQNSLQFGITYAGYGMPGWEQVTANSSAWQEVTKTFKASNSNSATTSLYFKILEDSKTGTVYIDNVKIEEVTEELQYENAYAPLYTNNFNGKVEKSDLTNSDFDSWNLRGLVQSSVTQGSLAYKKVDDNMVLAFTRVSAATGNPYFTYYGTPLEIKNTYRVSCKVKSESTELTLGICYDGYGLGWQQVKASSSEWKDITATFTATKSGDTPSLYFKIMDSTNTGTVYIDDIKIEKVIQEPATAYTANGIVSVDETYALRMGIADSAVTYAYASALTAGNKYEYAYKVKNASDTEAAVLTFAGKEITLAAGGEWKTETGIFTAEKGAAANLSIVLTSGAAYLDDIEVYQHHCTEVTVKGTAATCEDTGLTDGSKCAVCGEIIQKQNVIPANGHTYQNKVAAKYLKSKATCKKAAVYYKSCKDCGTKGTETFTSGKALGHNYKTTVTKATTSKNGKIVKQCSRCEENSSTTIYKASKVSLKNTSLTYTGKAQKPTVIVKDSKGNTISSNHYTVTGASGCTKVGTYTVKVKFKGNYSGTKTLTFKINPAKVSIEKVTAAKKGFTVKLAKQKTSLVNGYQVKYSTSKSFKKPETKTITNKGKTISYKVSGLTKNKKYYVKVRAYKKVDGKKYYSAWSAVKNVTTKQ